jgi:hypothetical protein
MAAKENHGRRIAVPKIASYSNLSHQKLKNPLLNT